MPQDCRFNICSFAQSYEYLFADRSVSYTTDSLHQAHDYLKNLKSEVSGARLEGALSELFKRGALSEECGQSKLLVILGGGQIWDKLQVSTVLRENRFA